MVLYDSFRGVVLSSNPRGHIKYKDYLINKKNKYEILRKIRSVPEKRRSRKKERHKS